MAVLAMVLSGAVLIFCAVIFAHRLAGAPERKRGRGDCAGGGGTDAWVPATVGGDGGECGGADGGGGCDGGGGGD